MTRARWILSAASLFALWLIGALVCLPRLQRDLETAARSMLAQQPSLSKRLGGLHLAFDGQQARLTGTVRTPQDRRAIESAVSDLVRVPAPLSGSLNPVGSVLNDIEVVPCPPGWLLLAANGTHARLLGTAANEYEARDLARSVQERWSEQGGQSEGTPDTDADHHDEAAQVSATLRTVPAPQATAQAYLARIGQSWQELVLDKTNAVLFTDANTLGISAAEWQHQILPVLDDLRAMRQQQHREETERARLAGLPPGYLFIAVRDQQIILRGEVGTAAMKHGILADALILFAPRRLHDEIRVSALRRPSGDLGPITTALLPVGNKAGGKSCFLSLSGAAWKPVDWQIAASEQSWKQALPAGLDPKPLQHDSARFSDWLQRDAPKEPGPALEMETSFITLALFDSKAVISGQVAEEAVREQMIAGVKKAYGARFLVISDAMHVRGNCEPGGNILQTINSLPQISAASSARLFAIARPGGTWTIIPVKREIVEAGGLAKSGLLPAGIPAGVVNDITADAIEQLRLNLANPVSQ